ncbi:MAG: hypothetical protein RJA70_3667 [Pseudomonadota bacterium]|jgi:hypothetical protein
MRITKLPPLSRRSWLLGSAGAVISLPWLEAMSSKAEAQASASPARFMVMFAGLSTHTATFIAPPAFGPNYPLAPALAPLGVHGVQGDVSVISGLLMPTIGPGSYAGEWHANNMGPLLSGVSTPGVDNRALRPVPRGPTADQLVVDSLAGNARFRSLELRVQPEPYRENTESAGTLSYRMGPGGLQANTPQASPSQAFKSLFGGQVGGNPEDPALLARLAQGRSVLDLVEKRSTALLNRLGTADQQRLERHLDEVRAIEARLMTIEALPGGVCRAPMQPPPDPGVASGPATNANGDARIVGFGDENARALVMTDLLHMALTCDMTRTATLAYTFAQCFIDSFLLLGRGGRDLHQLGHAGGTAEDITAAIAWHTDHFSRLVKLMKDTPEGNGNLLTNTAMVLLFEGGGNGGDPHTGEHMVALTAGTAGGIQAGVHVNGAGAHPVSVLISAMQAVGRQSEQMGEVTGGIPGLRA